MKIFKVSLLLIAALCILAPQSAYASAQAGDSLVTWNTATSTEGSAFTKATVTVTGVDTSGNYTYYGVDIGVFKDDGTTVYMKRVPTNYLKIDITDFGDITKYDYNQTYVIGYRDLYQPVYSNASPLTETVVTCPPGINDQNVSPIIEDVPWKRVSNSYFRVKNPNAKPTVTTGAASSITTTTATFNGNITSLGVPNPTDYGFVYGRVACASTSISKGAATTTGAYSSSVTGLTAGATYYVKAYATNAAGTVYGNEALFTTRPLAPTLTVSAASSTSINISWNAVTGATNYILYRNGNWITTVTSSTLNYTDTGASLAAGKLAVNTPYTYTIYSYNSSGYSSPGTGSKYTLANSANNLTLETVTTNSITYSWGANGNPSWTYYQYATQLVSDSSCPDMNYTQSTSHTTSGLNSGTQYYLWVRVFNGDLIANGWQIIAQTYTLALPTVTTGAVGNITTTTATFNGNITSLGIPNPTAYGFVYGTTTGPTTSNYVNNKGAATTTGTYSSSITGLIAGTKYYVRAYATNAASTVYGTEVSFTTLSTAPTFTVTAASSTSMNISWSAVPGAVSYQVYRKKYDESDASRIRIADVGSSTLSTPDTGEDLPDGKLDVNTQYIYTMTSWNSSGLSSMSPGVAKYTLANPANNLALGTVTTNSLAYSWGTNGNPSEANGNPSGTTYQYVTQLASDSTWVDSGSITGTSHVSSGLNPGTQYKLWVQVFNGDGISATSGNYQLIAQTYTLPLAPTPVVTAASTTSMNISCSAVTGAASYQVYRDGAMIKDVESSTLNYTDTGLDLSGGKLAANTQYTYTMTSWNTSGISSTSTPGVKKYTLANPANNLALGTVATNSITYSWGANGNPSGTKYTYVTQLASDSTWVDSGSITGTSHVSSGLNPGTQYKLWVQVFNGDGISATSNNYQLIAQPYTLIAGPNVSRVVTPSGASSGKNRVQLSWPAVPGATGYRIWVFDGANYRWDINDIPGSVTSWDSDAAKIYPTTLSGFNGSANPFKWDKTGQPFPASWNDMYKASGGSYQGYSYYSWIYIASKDAAGNLSGSGPGAAGVTSACGPLTDTDAPPIPSIASGTSTTSSVTLNATPVTDKYMTAYYPGSGMPTNGYYFRSINNKTGEVKYSGWTGSSYTFTGLTPNISYSFSVIARDNNGNGTPYSLSANITTNVLPAPTVTRTVTSSGVNSTKNRVQLSWSPVPGAVGYGMWIYDGISYRWHDIGNVTSWDSDAEKIYPTSIPTGWKGAYDPFNTTKTGQPFPASWNDMYKASGGSYQDFSYYSWIHIVSKDAAGNLSGSAPWSAGVTSVCGTLIDTDAPITPTITAGTITSTSITLNGSATDKYMTANYPGSGIASDGYYFRSINNKTGEVKYSDWTGTSYTFTGLTPNISYSFSVMARDNNGNYTGFSTPLSRYTLADIPVNLKVLSDASGNKWTATWAGNGTNYHLQWSSDNSTWTDIGWTSGATTYVDTSNPTVSKRYYRVKARNGDGVDSAYCASVKAAIIPTLNVPTVTGLIYMGEDITLSDTGTNIDKASYRIYFTRDVNPPTITTGNSTPGAGWEPSTINDNMNVLSSTSIQQLIKGVTYSDKDWTYLTFLVGAASVDNIWVYNCSAAYSLSSDANSYINYVGHNQIIKVFSTNKEIVVSDPNTLALQYGPYDSDTLNGLSTSNTFVKGDIVKYRLEFDILKPAPIKDIEVLFDFNLFNEEGVELSAEGLTLSEMVLKKMQPDGTFTLIKDLDSSYTKESRNRYIVRLGNDNSNNPIIAANGVGRYAIEYIGRLNITQYDMGTSFLMRNEGQMSIYSAGRLYPDTLEPKRPGRKFHIETKVSKQNVIYR